MKNQKFSPQAQSLQVDDVNEPAAHYFARLMTPSEVAHATLRQPLLVRQKTLGHWVLCGDVAAPMFALMRKTNGIELPTRLTCFNTTCGVSYGVITHQVLNHQHRFVLPLYDAAVRVFLESITTTGRLTFMLGNNDGDDSLLIECPFTPSVFMPVLAMTREFTEDEQLDAIEELPNLAALMDNLLQVPSLLGNQPVQHVSISLLLPGNLQNVIEKALDRAARV